MPKTYPALEKLRFSKRQEFFWIGDAALLSLISAAAQRSGFRLVRFENRGNDGCGGRSGFAQVGGAVCAAVLDNGEP